MAGAVAVGQTHGELKTVAIDAAHYLAQESNNGTSQPFEPVICAGCIDPVRRCGRIDLGASRCDGAGATRGSSDIGIHCGIQQGRDGLAAMVRHG